MAVTATTTRLPQVELWDRVTSAVGRRLGSIASDLVVGTRPPSEFYAAQRAIQVLNRLAEGSSVSVDRYFGSAVNEPIILRELLDTAPTEELVLAGIAKYSGRSLALTIKPTGRGLEAALLNRWHLAGAPVPQPLFGISTDDLTDVSYQVGVAETSSTARAYRESVSIADRTDRLVRAVDALHARSFTLPRLDPWTRRARAKLSNGMPLLISAGFTLPQRVGQMLRLVDGSNVLHGRASLGNIVTAEHDERDLLLAPRGWLGSPEIDYAIAALADADAGRARRTMGRAIEVCGLRPDAAWAACALQALIVASTRLEVLRAPMLTQRHRIVISEACVATIMPPLLGGHAGARLRQTLQGGAQGRLETRVRSEFADPIDDLIGLASEAIERTLTSAAWRERSDRRSMHTVPFIVRTPEGNLMSVERDADPLVVEQRWLAATDASAVASAATPLPAQLSGGQASRRMHPPGQAPPSDVRASGFKYGISVVTATTEDRMEMLRTAHASVCSQLETLDDRFRLEWVIISDGPTDKLQALVDELQAAEAGVEIRLMPSLSLGGSGPAVLRNLMYAAVKGATGHFVCTLDDDDAFVDNHSISDRVEPFILHPGIGWTGGDTVVWVPRRSVEGVAGLPRAEELGDAIPNGAPPGLVTTRHARAIVLDRAATVTREELTLKGQFVAMPVGMMVRTDVMRAIAGDAGARAGEDAIRVLQICLRTPGVMLDRPVMAVRTTNSSITRSASWAGMYQYHREQMNTMAAAMDDLGAPLVLPPLWRADGLRSLPSALQQQYATGISRVVAPIGAAVEP